MFPTLWLASSSRLLVWIAALMIFVAGPVSIGAQIGEGEVYESSAPDGLQPVVGISEVVPETAPEQITAITTDWLRVTGSVVRPRSSSISFVASGGGGCTYHTGGSVFMVWNAPVYLPQGATVNYLRMYYDDTSATDSGAWFTVYDLYGDIVQEWGVSSSGSSGNSYNDSALIDHVVDYSRYSYTVNWRPNVTGSVMQLCGFRIFYFDPNLFSDGLESGDTDAWSSVTP